MIAPLSLAIGIISRLRNRSMSMPPSRSETSPVRASDSGGKAFAEELRFESLARRRCIAYA